MTVVNYYDLIIKWAEDRNLIKGTTFEKQFVKLIEETGELAAGIARGDLVKIKDSVGDVAVVLFILNAQKGEKPIGIQHILEITDFSPEERLRSLIYEFSNIKDLGYDAIFHSLLILNDIAHLYAFTLQDCTASAYEEIKNRKGRMVDGIFIKEEDL